HPGQRLRRWNRHTANGRNTTVISSGHRTAPVRACCSIQYPLGGAGWPNRSRIAVAVDETGFQAAIVPSQPGISAGGANTEEIIANGNPAANRLPAVSVLRTSSPR